MLASHETFDHADGLYTTRFVISSWRGFACFFLTAFLSCIFGVNLFVGDIKLVIIRKWGEVYCKFVKRRSDFYRENVGRCSEGIISYFIVLEICETFVFPFLWRNRRKRGMNNKNINRL